MQEPLTIYTKNLVKRYSNRTVVNNVSFEVSQGEIVGLLGPNGAGKTTSFYQVVGLVKPDSGDIFLNDSILFWSLFLVYYTSVYYTSY
jgi:lipopolysaccharide export system ATP-binding protein